MGLVATTVCKKIKIDKSNNFKMTVTTCVSVLGCQTTSQLGTQEWLSLLQRWNTPWSAVRAQEPRAKLLVLNIPDKLFCSPENPFSLISDNIGNYNHLSIAYNHEDLNIVVFSLQASSKSSFLNMNTFLP